jgi:hypothetical protein
MAQTFERDAESGLIVSVDDTQYKQILAARQRKKETNTIIQRLDSIDAQLIDIKKTLQLLVDGMN